MNQKSSTQCCSGFRQAILDGLPTLLVLLTLGGLAYWGHATGWAMPKFSALFSRDGAEKDDWCKEHPVPAADCVECHDELLPKTPLTWCKKHGVHNCLFEQPELAQLPSAPIFNKEDLDRAQRALDLKDRVENNWRCKLSQRRIQFASKEAMDRMGVGVIRAEPGPIVETVAASGEIGFEQPRVAPIFTPVGGRIWLLTEQGEIGRAVKRDEVLALIEAPDIGKSKAEFLQAVTQLGLKTKAFEINKELVNTGAVSKIAFNEAEAAQREAAIRLIGAQQTLVNLGLPPHEDAKNQPPAELGKYLQFLGIPDSIRRRLDPSNTSTNLYPVRAARDGVVTAVKVVAGEVVEPTKPLFVVTDTSRLWLTLNVRADDLKYLRVADGATRTHGQMIRFRPDGVDAEVSGELIWRGAQADEKTRTVQFRAEIPNPKGELLANTYGMGRIILREEPKALLVPNSAIHWEGNCHVVFVQDKNFHKADAPKVFHVRTVRIGVRNGETTEIIAGLAPGEVVAAENSASLRAELLKDTLGAG